MRLMTQADRAERTHRRYIRAAGNSCASPGKFCECFVISIPHLEPTMATYQFKVHG
ncbi:hypothetical protein CYLTODRAFT_425643 [Cylindrobasidium torrendii FP15055 ss-10]|uniref:Uncharacterized protein n=1 Tax=Cylindrobasidium torrendii FP15055 ss-10 TaxID=1314674 RepID=A0A0D7B358_9AGAR|nr:hypothetical protein CYLTODRAFT_425643 [Cylindrobasidium torrendii FP15055 ss-10]